MQAPPATSVEAQAFVSERANDGIWRYFGQCSRLGYLRDRYGHYLHLFFLLFKSLLHHLASILFFTLSSSFATFIAVEVSLESILPRHHPVASATSCVFLIPERYSELIHFSIKL
jgi:hypothetical protein